MAFLAYCLQVTLKHRLMIHPPGLTPAAVMEKLAAVQMIDIHIPTTDGRCLILPRYNQPGSEVSMILDRLKLESPEKPLPRITAQQATHAQTNCAS